MEISRSRRCLLATAPLCALSMLGACAATTANGVTTVTINLNTLENYATAVKDGVTTLLSVPLISTAIGAAKTLVINAAVADMAAQVAALNAANQGVATFTFTATSIPAAVTAFETDARALMADVVAVASGLTGSLAANIVTTTDALQTVLALGTAVASTNVGTIRPRMSASQALKLLGA
jgi:hypothetical protein